MQSFGIDIRDQLHGHRSIDLYECGQCGLRFFSPPEVAGDGRLYSELERLPGYYMPRKWEHDVAMQRLRRGERVLEIGCAEGSFVQRLRAELDCDAEGIELNESSAATARSNGIPVEIADVQRLAVENPASYDVVCGFQVLEHVPDPLPFLRAAIALLRPGGRLLMCVPNHDSFLRHQWNLLDMPPHHMTQWTARTFRSMQQCLAVQLTWTANEPLAAYHVKGFVTTYARHFGRQSSFQKLVWNGATRLLLRGILNAGLRHFVRGQSLFIELSHIPSRTTVPRPLASRASTPV